jgi:hypothetical protein
VPVPSFRALTLRTRSSVHRSYTDPCTYTGRHVGVGQRAADQALTCAFGDSAARGRGTCERHEVRLVDESVTDRSRIAGSLPPAQGTRPPAAPTGSSRGVITQTTPLGLRVSTVLVRLATLRPCVPDAGHFSPDTSRSLQLRELLRRACFRALPVPIEQCPEFDAVPSTADHQRRDPCTCRSGRLCGRAEVNASRTSSGVRCGTVASGRPVGRLTRGD